MLPIAALNDASSEEETWGRKPSHKTTKEAQESEAMATYNHALSLQRKGSLVAAEEAFTKLLQSSFLKQVTVSSEDEESVGLVQTSHVLKYSTYTNLAGLCTQRGDQNTAMEYYLQAVNLDSTDVSLWYKIGSLALKIHNYPLARHAFEQGLECNSSHWPCLDRVITVLYTLNNYIACLIYISQALQKDPGYIKGLVIKEQIFKEQPGLRHDTLHLFEQCGEDLSDDGIDDSEKQEIIEEALLMRRKKQERERRPPIPWKNVGERLVSLYDFIISGKSDARLVSKLDLSSYQTLDPSVPLQQVVTMETEPVQTKQPATAHTPLENQSKDVTMSTESTVLPAQDSGMDESFTQPAKRGPKRKRMVPEDGAGKRRSARVRNTSKKKEEESINFKEILQEFLPSSLLRAAETSEEPPPQGESHVEPMDLSARSEEENQSTPTGSQKGVTNQAGYQTEQVDVHNFLKLCVENSGIIDVTNQYLIEVANRMRVAWPPGLTDVYLKAYSRIRKHLRMPNVLCKDEPDERFGDLGQMCLVYAELKMDKWIASRNRGASLSPRKSPGAPAVLGPDFPGQFFTDDLEFLLDLTGSPSTMSHKWLDLCLRVCWMRGHYLVLCGKTDFAGAVYFKCFTYLDLAEAEGQATTIHIPYCTVDNTISAKTVQQQLESLERCQSLEAVQRLHDSGDHQQVVRLLLQTFTQPAGPEQPVSLPAAERHAQLLLLQSSLLELKDYKQCLVWSEVSLNEALQQLMGAASHSSREEWGSTMLQLFQGINKCLSEDKQDHSWSLSPKNLVRLTQNLIQIIQVSMDGSDYSDYRSVNSVFPWILLYRLILHEEKRLKSLQTDPDNSFDSCMPSSIMLLNMAHEYLGRRSWCTLSGGALLQFMVDEMSELLNTSATYREELEQALEQCFYCLYGHPNKRGKAKHLQDHNVATVPLSWTHAIKVFEFFKPKTVPEFDSYKTSTVSGELENLLRRIATLVPQDQTYISVDAVTSFVDGSLQQAPALPPDVPTERPVVKELYYLLADYYFKNKEQAKAIKFYILDLCENPDRFDSWAGMSLARMSRLEQKLNSHELKTEAPVQKQALAALRCFKQALQLDSSNSKLWIEHGSLAYQMHSHASRQLKQLSMFPLSEEFHQMSIDNKREMLELAYKCYSTAAQCEGEDYAEEWLHHYMLGKIAEKMNQNPKVFLQHYKQAAFHLHEDHAHYPKKITYIYSPPHLALESLEVFYRMHVSILKYLLKSTDNTSYKLFEGYLQQARESPFVSMKEKKKKERRDSAKEQMTSSADESGILIPVPPAPGNVTITRHPKPFRGAKPDHTYSKPRGVDSSSSADESSMDTSKLAGIKSDHSAFMSPAAKRPLICQAPVIPSQASTVSPCSTSVATANTGVTAAYSNAGVTAAYSNAGITVTHGSSGGSAAEQPCSSKGFSMDSLLSDVITKQLFKSADSQPRPATLNVVSTVSSNTETPYSSAAEQPTPVSKPGQTSTVCSTGGTTEGLLNTPVSVSDSPAVNVIPMETEIRAVTDTPTSTLRNVHGHELSTDDQPELLPVSGYSKASDVPDLITMATASLSMTPEASGTLAASEPNNPLVTAVKSSPPVTAVSTVTTPIAVSTTSSPPVTAVTTSNPSVTAVTTSTTPLTAATSHPTVISSVSCPAVTAASTAAHASVVSTAVAAVSTFLTDSSEPSLDEDTLATSSAVSDKGQAVSTTVVSSVDSTGDFSVIDAVSEQDKLLRAPYHRTPMEVDSTSVSNTAAVSGSRDPLKREFCSEPDSTLLSESQESVGELTTGTVSSSDGPGSGTESPSTVKAMSQRLEEMLESQYMSSDSSMSNRQVDTAATSMEESNDPSVSTTLKETVSPTPMDYESFGWPLSTSNSSDQVNGQTVSSSGLAIENQAHSAVKPSSDCMEKQSPASTSLNTDSAVVEGSSSAPTKPPPQAPFISNVPLSVSSVGLPSEAHKKKEPTLTIINTPHGQLGPYEDISSCSQTDSQSDFPTDMLVEDTGLPTVSAESSMNSCPSERQVSTPGTLNKAAVDEETGEETSSSSMSSSRPLSPISQPPEGKFIPINVTGKALSLTPVTPSPDILLDGAPALYPEEDRMDTNPDTENRSPPALSKHTPPIDRVSPPSGSHGITKIVPKREVVADSAVAGRTSEVSKPRPDALTDVIPVKPDSEGSSKAVLVLDPDVPSIGKTSPHSVDTPGIREPTVDVKQADKDGHKPLNDAENNVPMDTTGEVPQDGVKMEVHNKEESGDVDMDMEGTKSDQQSKENTATAKDDKVTKGEDGGLDKSSTGDMMKAELEEAEDVDMDEKSIQLKQLKLMEKCMEGLAVCLGRFPHHHKCLYRLAYVYYHSSHFRDLHKCRDLLLGNANWTQLSHMPCPGLFQDRKQTNFFNGLWRIPIEEIDRPGSFATHITKSIRLLLEVLQELSDVKTLLQIHQMLSRTPEQGKKYIRDNDRVFLAKQALNYTVDALESAIINAEDEDARELPNLTMQDVYRVWQYTTKSSQTSHRLNSLLTQAFQITCSDKIVEGMPLLEQALRHCQQICITPSRVPGDERLRKPSSTTGSDSSLLQSHPLQQTESKPDEAMNSAELSGSSHQAAVEAGGQSYSAPPDIPSQGKLSAAASHTDTQGAAIPTTYTSASHTSSQGPVLSHTAVSGNSISAAHISSIDTSPVRNIVSTAFVGTGHTVTPKDTPLRPAVVPGSHTVTPKATPLSRPVVPGSHTVTPRATPVSSTVVPGSHTVIPRATPVSSTVVPGSHTVTPQATPVSSTVVPGSHTVTPRATPVSSTVVPGSHTVTPRAAPVNSSVVSQSQILAAGLSMSETPARLASAAVPSSSTSALHQREPSISTSSVQTSLAHTASSLSSMLAPHSTVQPLTEAGRITGRPDFHSVSSPTQVDAASSAEVKNQFPPRLCSHDLQLKLSRPSGHSVKTGSAETGTSKHLHSKSQQENYAGTEHQRQPSSYHNTKTQYTLINNTGAASSTYQDQTTAASQQKKPRMSESLSRQPSTLSTAQLMQKLLADLVSKKPSSTSTTGERKDTADTGSHSHTSSKASGSAVPQLTSTNQEYASLSGPSSSQTPSIGMSQSPVSSSTDSYKLYRNIQKPPPGGTAAATSAQAETRVTAGSSRVTEENTDQQDSQTERRMRIKVQTAESQESQESWDVIVLSSSDRSDVE